MSVLSRKKNTLIIESTYYSLQHWWRAKHLWVLMMQVGTVLVLFSLPSKFQRAIGSKTDFLHCWKYLFHFSKMSVVVLPPITDSFSTLTWFIANNEPQNSVTHQNDKNRSIWWNPKFPSRKVGTALPASPDSQPLQSSPGPLEKSLLIRDIWKYCWKNYESSEKYFFLYLKY